MRFARERHEWRAYGYDVAKPEKGLGNVVLNQIKGPWRIKPETALADAEKIDREHVVVQKVRIGVTKVLETRRVK